MPHVLVNFCRYCGHSISEEKEREMKGSLKHDITQTKYSLKHDIPFRSISEAINLIYLIIFMRQTRTPDGLMFGIS